VEANDRQSLSRGMAGVVIRMARAVNRVLQRRGPIWSCRYHSRALTTPREVRNAIVYVIFNLRKHAPGNARIGCVLVSAVARRMGDAPHGVAVRRAREPARTQA
jgi:hypothetical protein